MASTTTRQSHHDVGVRVQALTLLEFGVPPAQVTALTGVSRSTMYHLRKTAIARGYDAKVSRRILLEYVVDGARSGRPRKVVEQVVVVVVGEEQVGVGDVGAGEGGEEVGAGEEVVKVRMENSIT